MNSSWTISNPKRWCCESAVLKMPANLENSAVATGLEKISFHSNPKERQCQRMLKFSSVQSLSCVRLLVTPWSAAHQAPSMGFSRQEYWSGLPLWVQLCSSLSILWHCLSLRMEWKLTFSSPVATAEFSKFAGILSAALSQHHLSGFEIAPLEFHHLH